MTRRTAQFAVLLSVLAAAGGGGPTAANEPQTQPAGVASSAVDAGLPTALPEDVGMWRREQIDQGIAEIPVDGDIGIRAADLRGFHGDPADRIIVATALGGHRLATADRRILEWSGELNCLPATD